MKTAELASMRLLSPIRVGTHTLKNWVIMASMHTRLDYMHKAIEREVAYYRERGQGLCGADRYQV